MSNQRCNYLFVYFSAGYFGCLQRPQLFKIHYLSKKGYLLSRVHNILSPLRDDRKPLIFQWVFTLRNAGIGSVSNPAFYTMKNEWLPVVTKRRQYIMNPALGCIKSLPLQQKKVKKKKNKKIFFFFKVSSAALRLGAALWGNPCSTIECFELGYTEGKSRPTPVKGKTLSSSDNLQCSQANVSWVTLNLQVLLLLASQMWMGSWP